MEWDTLKASKRVANEEKKYLATTDNNKEVKEWNRTIDNYQRKIDCRKRKFVGDISDFDEDVPNKRQGDI